MTDVKDHRVPLSPVVVQKNVAPSNKSPSKIPIAKPRPVPQTVDETAPTRRRRLAAAAAVGDASSAAADGALKRGGGGGGGNRRRGSAYPVKADESGRQTAVAKANRSSASAARAR